MKDEVRFELIKQSLEKVIINQYCPLMIKYFDYVRFDKD